MDDPVEFVASLDLPRPNRQAWRNADCDMAAASHIAALTRLGTKAPISKWPVADH